MNKILEQTSKVRLRAGRLEDAIICGNILYQGFRGIAQEHGFESDFSCAEVGTDLWEELFANPMIYSVVAETEEGRIIGCNFLWYGDIIAGVGPISVDPAAQKRSVGRRMMENVLQRAKEKRCAGVRLVQAGYNTHSLALYTKLGFDVREPLALMQGQPLNLTIPGHLVRSAIETDLEACNSLCYRVHGYYRADELTRAVKQGTATLVEYEGRISGYATNIGILGHALCETNEDLKALIGAALVITGPGFLVPMRNSNLLRWCLQQGLRVIHTETLMSLGLYNEPAGVFLPSVIS